MFFYLYLILDVWSRKIVGFEVYDRESPDLAADLVRRTCMAEGIDAASLLVLHSDNGGPMKGATMLATLDRLGVTTSFSRPRVSDDNPFSESLFRTLEVPGLSTPKRPSHHSDTHGDGWRDSSSGTTQFIAAARSAS